MLYHFGFLFAPNGLWTFEDLTKLMQRDTESALVLENIQGDICEKTAV